MLEAGSFAAEAAVVAAQSPAQSAPGSALRLADYRRLFSAARFDAPAYFGSFPLWLPFRLGETQADAAVPYVLGEDLVAAAEQAAQELLDFFRRRREGELPQEVSIYLENQPRRLPAWRVFPGLLEGSFAGAVAARALRMDPLLDAGLMEAWMSRGACGAAFIEALHALFGKALEVDLAAGAETPFLYTVALAFTGLVEALKRFPKAVQIRGASYDRLEKALGFAFFAVAAELLERVLTALAARQLPFETESYALRIRLALNPLAFCAIRKSALFNDLNPYGIASEWAAAVEPLYADLIALDADVRHLEERLRRLLLSDRALGDTAAAAGRQMHLREAVLGFLARFDAFDPGLGGKLAAAAVRDQELAQLPRRAREIIGGVAPLGARRLQPVEAAALAGLRQALRGEVDREALIGRAAEGFIAFALDRFAVEHLDAARARLRNRRDELPPPRIEAEYAEGKLYRLAAGPAPFLRAAARANQGHLFIDLKGFTQRTYRAKEVVMAEFMRAEFYAPILRAARAHASSGAGVPALSLQNLLGDAAVFSGDVRALVQLARDIQQHLASYAEKLRARLGSAGIDAETRMHAVRAEAEEKAFHLQMELSMLEAELARKRQLDVDRQEELLWDLYARRAFALEKKRMEAEMAGLGAEAERLRQAERQLQQERAALDEAVQLLEGSERQAHIDERICAPERARRAEIQRELASLAENTRVLLRALEEEARSAGGYGLEAGLFVTYGAPAERVELDDPTFGTVKVAIAEKINEAARGTARAAAIRSKLEALLERARRRRPLVELPFCVYVDQTYSLVFSSELTAMVEGAVAAKDTEQGTQAARALADALQHDLAKMMGQPDPSASGMLTVINDIYNVGEAFSEEAVEAFLRETRSTRFAFRRGLAIAELHPEIRERFLFTSDALDLRVSVPLPDDLADALVFRLAGHVHFRGFEAKRATAVFELLRPSSAFMKLLAAHHLRAWLDEARAAASVRPGTRGA